MYISKRYLLLLLVHARCERYVLCTYIPTPPALCLSTLVPRQNVYNLNGAMSQGCHNRASRPDSEHIITEQYPNCVNDMVTMSYVPYIVSGVWVYISLVPHGCMLSVSLCDKRGPDERYYELTLCRPPALSVRTVTPHSQVTIQFWLLTAYVYHTPPKNKRKKYKRIMSYKKDWSDLSDMTH